MNAIHCLQRHLILPMFSVIEDSTSKLWFYYSCCPFANTIFFKCFFFQANSFVLPYYRISYIIMILTCKVTSWGKWMSIKYKTTKYTQHTVHANSWKTLFSIGINRLMKQINIRGIQQMRLIEILFSCYNHHRRERGQGGGAPQQTLDVL